MTSHLILTIAALATLMTPLSVAAKDVPSADAAGLPAGKVATLEPIKDALKYDSRLRLVQSKGPFTTRCAAADLGNFVILTSYRCLSDWWNDKSRNRVEYSTDTRRESTYGSFKMAHRDPFGSPRWAILETSGHTGGFFGYQDLSSDMTPLSRTYTLVGVSKKVKGGRQLTVQKDCSIDRTQAGAFVSLCGGGFDESGFLILSGSDTNIWVHGLATVAATGKSGRRLVHTLNVVSSNTYGQTLARLRENQADRYRAQLDLESSRRIAAAREHDLDHGNLDHGDLDHRRSRRQSGPKASAVLLQGLTDLADTLNRNRTGTTPPAAPTPLPIEPTGLAGRDSYVADSNRAIGNSKWYPSGGVTVAAGQTVQVRVVDGRGSRVAYLNISLGHPTQGTEGLKMWEAQMSVMAGNTSHRCDLEINGTMDVNDAT